MLRGNVDTFVQEVARLRSGRASDDWPIRIIVFRRWWNSSLLGMATNDRSEPDLWIALFDPAARPRTRALIVVPAANDHDLDELPEMTAAHAYGSPEIGSACAIAVRDELVLPIGPNVAPTWRTPTAR